ncbi:MAG TPA: efflux RND transporter periplasmic adaptor subunit [Candidatus Binataceae bacterium]|nr:efflux RND transporter periplasmic adaptor subunit [Candidatus Binataceae bacterium]
MVSLLFFHWLKPVAAESSPGAGEDNGQGARAPVHLSVAQKKLIGIRFGTVKEENVNVQIDAPGSIALDERNESYVQLRTPGWIQSVAANQTWASIRKGDPLFTLYSPEIETDEQSYISSLREYIGLASNSSARVKQGAASIVNAAIDRLRYVGVSDREVRRLSRGGAASGQIEIYAPTTGVIIERNAYPNMYAEPSTRLYTIADLSDVWAYAPVFQDQLALIKPGDKVTMTMDAYPGETFAGTVQFIWPKIDATTRAGRVRCAFNNADGRLKIGMAARIVIEASLGQALTIPRSGVLRTGDGDVAFVEDPSGDLRPVLVELGPRVDAGFVVKHGLRPGERIVTAANFLVDAESQSEAEMAGFAVASGPDDGREDQGSAANIMVTTKPAPMRRGSNKIDISLSDSFGRPIDGADVSILFYMSAMPEMSMAAMRVAVKASAAGSHYSAAVSLPADGDWRMTVIARKDGREIARTQENIAAVGPG